MDLLVSQTILPSGIKMNNDDIKYEEIAKRLGICLAEKQMQDYLDTLSVEEREKIQKHVDFVIKKAIEQEALLKTLLEKPFKRLELPKSFFQDEVWGNIEGSLLDEEKSYMQNYIEKQNYEELEDITPPPDVIEEINQEIEKEEEEWGSLSRYQKWNPDKV